MLLARQRVSIRLLSLLAAAVGGGGGRDDDGGAPVAAAKHLHPGKKRDAEMICNNRPHNQSSHDPLREKGHSGKL